MTCSHVVIFFQSSLFKKLQIGLIILKQRDWNRNFIMDIMVYYDKIVKENLKLYLCLNFIKIHWLN